jgi:hybrid cluster-associated redox disulfide protein
VKRSPTLSLDLPLDDIMREWPATIAVMLRHRFLCVGCPIAPFHTIVDACREYDVDTDTVLAEMRGAIAGI